MVVVPALVVPAAEVVINGRGHGRLDNGSGSGSDMYRLCAVITGSAVGVLGQWQ